MATDSILRGERLVNLARGFFPNLTEAERRLLRAAPEGARAICGPSDKDDDHANDPALGDQAGAARWGPEREIRAELIRWLCVDQEASKSVDARGVWAYGARVTGELDLSFADVPFPLSLFRCSLTTDCNLIFVKIPALYFNGSATRGIGADGADVKGCITLSSGFSSVGQVRLAGAQIGFFVGDGGHFHNKGVQALNANGADIKGGVFLRSSFSEGEVNLTGAHIRGPLDCTGSSFQNPDRKALCADKAEIDGSVFLKAFSAVGEVNLRSARIGSNLECSGGSFHNPRGASLDAAGAAFSGYVMLNDGFLADGRISMKGARIESGLDCTGGGFAALDFATMTVKQAFIWRSIQGVTILDLQGVSAGILSDDEKSWPANGKLYLTDFVYGRIGQGPTDAPARLRWLSLQSGIAPQPYRQLAKFLAGLGDDGGAKQVLYALEDRTRRSAREGTTQAGLRWWNAPSRWFQSVQNALSRAIIGYGIYPGRAIWFLCAMVAFGWMVYVQAQRVGAMAPKDATAYDEFHGNNGRVPAAIQPFTPLVYSLENSIPLVKFGQDDQWQPDSNPRLHPSAPVDETTVFRQMAAARNLLLDALLPVWITSPVFLRGFRWFTIAFGWLLTTFFVAALSGITKTGSD